MKTELKEIQKTVDFPLTDGSVARITESGSYCLEEDFGVTSGRIRRGKGGEAVMVRPTLCYGKPVPKPAKEVVLRDLLAVWVYYSPELRNPEPSQSFYLVDGNARNLTPENIALTERPEIRWPEPKERKKKHIAEVPLSTKQLFDELGEIFPEMQKHVLTLIRRSKWQATEVLAEVLFELLRQIRNGTCPAKNKNELYVWAFGSLKLAAKWKRDAIRDGRCRDVDHDKAAIRLARVVRKNAELLEAAGLSVGSPVWLLPEGVPTADLARQFEADAAKQAALEDKRIEDEGGIWKSSEDEYAAAGFTPGYHDKPEDADPLLTQLN